MQSPAQRLAGRAAAGRAASTGETRTFKALSEVEENKMHLRFAENQLRPLPTARPGHPAAPAPAARWSQARRRGRPSSPHGAGPRTPAGAAPGGGASALRLRPLRARQVLGAENWDFVGQLKTQTSHLARKDPALNSPIRRRLQFLISNSFN